MIDFTKKSDTEIRQYLKSNSADKICGHFKNSQLANKKTKPANFHFNLQYYFTLVGIALISLFTSCREKLTGEVLTPEESQELHVTKGLLLPPKDVDEKTNKDSIAIDAINAPAPKK